MDERLTGIAKGIDELTQSIPAIQSFHDLAGLHLLSLIRVLNFCEEHAGSHEYATLLKGLGDAQLRFGNETAAIASELAARPLEATSAFTRKFGILPSTFARRLPRELRKALSPVRSNNTMSSIAAATSTLAMVEANIAILRSFPLLRHSRWQYLSNIIETLAIDAPAAIRSLPPDVLTWLSEEPPSYGPHCDLDPPIKEFVTENTTFVNFGTPMSNSSNRRVHAIGKAVATNDARLIDEAIAEIRRIRWYLTSTDKRTIPANWTTYNYDFNMRSFIRIASRAKILFDAKATAVFDTPDGRVVAYLPTLAGEVAAPSLADQASYDIAPLQFIISRRSDHVKSGVVHATHVFENTLNNLKRECWVGKNSERISAATKKLVGHIAHATPEATLTAATYYVIARQMGLPDPETVATLEGIVHAVIRTLSRAVRANPNA